MASESRTRWESHRDISPCCLPDICIEIRRYSDHACYDKINCLGKLRDLRRIQLYYPSETGVEGRDDVDGDDVVDWRGAPQTNGRPGA
jgi:hypothetical protein